MRLASRGNAAIVTVAVENRLHIRGGNLLEQPVVQRRVNLVVQIAPDMGSVLPNPPPPAPENIARQTPGR